ncbi:uncharacterized protein LOC111751848 [Loxodonta africana]|uniref:uncharacterized protein LOC111751848 n=1 Tax=Loxodonta africana TaxID=9785 RepID=UPI000C811F33|nr:uncharacterized protein LOC111751848 [Loxodonta africana]
MEILRTQARDTDPATITAAPTAAAPPVPTLLEDATPAASSGANMGQKCRDPKENGEVEKKLGLTLCQRAQVGALHPDAAPVHDVFEGASPAASSGVDRGKNGSRKGRNRKENKNVYLPWPLTLGTRASSAAPVLSQTSVVGALPAASSGVGESRNHRGDGEKKISILARPSKAPPGTLCPAASAVQASLEEASLAASGDIKMGQKSRDKGTMNKNRDILATPWPLTVQAWASFRAPEQAQTTCAGAFPVADGGVIVEHESRSQKGEMDQMSVLTLCQSTPAGASCPAAVPVQNSLEGSSCAANSGVNLREKNRRKRRNRKEKRVFACPWPLTVQVWASFRAADPVQTPFQGDSRVASAGVNVGQKSGRRQNSKEEAKSVLPWPVRVEAGTSLSLTAPDQISSQGAFHQEDIHSKFNKPRRRRQKRGDGKQLQSSVKQTLKSVQGWRNPERFPGDQNFWEHTVMNSARHVDCYYCEELCLKERMEALTLTKVHTHMDTSVMARQGSQVLESVLSQVAQSGNWGGL